MLFTAKTLSTLEYDKIVRMLVDCAATEGAKARAMSLIPTDDYELVLSRQIKTDDAKRLINTKGYPSFTAHERVVSAAERAYKGAILSPQELLEIAALLRSARAVLDYSNTDRTFESSLDELFSRVMPMRELEQRITRAIISEDMIADEASPALADIRRKIRQTNNKIKDTLQSYVGGARLKYLQENLVTMRNGRYVVPVKAEYRSSSGMVSSMALLLLPQAGKTVSNRRRDSSR